MTRTGKIVLLTAVSLASLVLSTQASADHRDDDGHKHGHWKKHHHSHQHYSHRHYSHQRVVRERVYVERPVYIERPVYVERHVQYVPPRSPAIVVSVDIPPLVFPLR